MIQESLAVFLLAVAFDILFGEPPARIHPVVWIGKTHRLPARPGEDPAGRRVLLWP